MAESGRVCPFQHTQVTVERDRGFPPALYLTVRANPPATGKAPKKLPTKSATPMASSSCDGSISYWLAVEYFLATEKDSMYDTTARITADGTSDCHVKRASTTFVMYLNFYIHDDSSP